MGILKEMVARGAYLIETGATSLDLWSRLMVDELGPNAKPFLYEIRQWSLIIAQRKFGSQSMKLNCWEFQKCGREANGKHAKQLGICPVYLCSELDGIHGGSNGGRSCWVAGYTKCGGIIKRMLVPHVLECISCNFRKTVIYEERSDCLISDRFLNMLIYEKMK